MESVLRCLKGNGGAKIHNHHQIIEWQMRRGSGFVNRFHGLDLHPGGGILGLFSAVFGPPQLRKVDR